MRPDFTYRAARRNEFAVHEDTDKVYRRLNTNWVPSPTVYVPYVARANKYTPHQGNQEIARRLAHAI